MGATEEQMAFLTAAHITHVSYVLILYSIAFLLYLFVNILLHIYATHTWPDDESNGQIALARKMRSQGHNRNVSFATAAGGSRSANTMPSPFLDVPDGDDDDEDESPRRNRMNGHAKPAPRMPKQHRVTDSQQVRDAEEFELEGLISDVDDDADDMTPSSDDSKGKSTRKKQEVQT